MEDLILLMTSAKIEKHSFPSSICLRLPFSEVGRPKQEYVVSENCCRLYTLAGHATSWPKVERLARVVITTRPLKENKLIILWLRAAIFCYFSFAAGEVAKVQRELWTCFAATAACFECCWLILTWRRVELWEWEAPQYWVCQILKTVSLSLNRNLNTRVKLRIEYL